MRATVYYNIVALIILAGGGEHSDACVSLCPLYDNRKCAVIWTADDLRGDNLPLFQQAVRAAERNGIVLTAGAITERLGSNSWNTVQQWYAGGAFALASHSATHILTLPETWNIEYEVSASQSTIVSQLNLPSWNKYKGRQYMTAWIQPCGTVREPQQTEFRRQLGRYHYLSDRSTSAARNGWDATNELFNRVGVTANISLALPKLNAVFDRIYRTGGIYHFYHHPVKNPITNGSVLDKHMQYIGGRKDVWYAGFEYVYTYKYLQSIHPPKIQVQTNNEQMIVFDAIASGKERSLYGLSYPLTYAVDVPGDWTNVTVWCASGDKPSPFKIVSMRSEDSFNGMDAFRFDRAHNRVYISKAFTENSNILRLFVSRAAAKSGKVLTAPAVDISL